MPTSASDRKQLGEIMKRLSYEGVQSDELLKRAWQELRKEKGIPEMTVQQRRYAMRKTFMNPKRKRSLGQCACNDKSTRRGKLRNSSPLKGYRINPRLSAKSFASQLKYINQRLGTDFTINSMAGIGLRIEVNGGSKEVSPRYKPFEMAIWLNGFLTCLNEYCDRKNPIAVYNPPGKKLPMRNVEIRYLRAGGEHKGQWFSHKYENTVDVIGLENGNVLLRSKSRKRLWGKA